MTPQLLPEEFARLLQLRAARVAVGSSAARGQGAPGLVDAGRTFVSTLNLEPFGTDNEADFQRSLDDATAGMMRALPRKGSTWGISRKLVNIFLRECLYTWHLRERFALHRGEPFFEMPLDSLTGKGLRKRDPSLPKWHTVKGLDPATSRIFQDAATRVAAAEGYNRVHLDLLLWAVR